MSARRPLNDRQVEVLRWIGAGCPAGAMEGFTYKTTAVALQSRRLVKVAKRAGVWSAVVTDDGRHYLARGDYPPAAAPADANRRPPPAPTTAPTNDRPARGATRVDVPRSATERLVDEVLAASGQLRIDRWDEKPNLLRLISAANRYGKVPTGQRLVHRWADGKTLVEMVDAPAVSPLRPVPVPATLRSAMAVVTALRKPEAPFPIAGAAVRRRALLLIQGLLAEADRRGHSSERFRQQREADPYRRVRSQHPPVFTVSIDGHGVDVTIGQEYDRVPHVPSKAELDRAVREAWYRVPSHDRVRTDRLRITLTGQVEQDRSTWADGKRQSLEAVLPQVLREIELRGYDAERRRLVAEEDRRQRQHRWERLMDTARDRYVENTRARLLDEQADRWRRTQDLDAYLAAMRGTVAGLDPADAADAQAWLAWCEQHRKNLDPLGQPLGMPEVPGPHPQDLTPFLPSGISPYGPR